MHIGNSVFQAQKHWSFRYIIIWFLYDNGLRHGRVKLNGKYLGLSNSVKFKLRTKSLTNGCDSLHMESDLATFKFWDINRDESYYLSSFLLVIFHALLCQTGNRVVKERSSRSKSEQGGNYLNEIFIFFTLGLGRNVLENSFCLGMIIK